ncbi:hypothetical protein COY54_02345 [Candidatus Falkowbacteria bacterium CG_4_10_14_0_8_um_filter_41_36]|uniref:Uncharacterized protein n=1 Tax=Candidatus Falkowbacteria bacterium CG_4_10_14_0_8_um_filter_41_36 TaxID=1974556 RepID=A0A2M7RYA3_9BACT|nr:MAG: hypothetical protein COY54_02345 [Candidatus Falkowbacteria bacterium CG_4_10_14_0_8_um_filter_41_36]
MNRFLGLNKKLKLNFLLFAIITIIGIGWATKNVRALNESPIVFTPQVTIPGSNFISETSINLEANTSPIAKYISAIYNYGVGIVGILGALMLMIGGIIWLTAAGSSSKIEQAKSFIGSSLTGLVLVLTAVILLQTVNPDLISFKPISVKNIADIPLEVDNPFFASKDSLPKDTQLGSTCVDSEGGCSLTDPPTITVEETACIEKFGETEWGNRKLACCGSSILCVAPKLWCCGSSATDKTKNDDWCKGRENGLACRPTMTSSIGMGYCSNGKCQKCTYSAGVDSSGAGKKCTDSWECANIAGYCGLDADKMYLAEDADCLKIVGANNIGYCAGEVSPGTNCDNVVGDLCGIDTCCPGLCCSHEGIFAVCVPGAQKGGDGGDGDSPDSCKY